MVIIVGNELVKAELKSWTRVGSTFPPAMGKIFVQSGLFSFDRKKGKTQKFRPEEHCWGKSAAHWYTILLWSVY